VLIENAFTVAKPLDQVWDYLLDVHKVAPCMPGAELTETIDDRNWKGKLTMKFGPVSMSFAGSVTLEERDEAAHRVVLHAKGTEQKGKGAADAKVTSWLEAVDAGTAVNCLEQSIAAAAGAGEQAAASTPSAAPAATPAAAKPVGGVRLGLAAAWSAVVSFFRRLFGGSTPPRA